VNQSLFWATLAITFLVVAIIVAALLNIFFSPLGFDVVSTLLFALAAGWCLAKFWAATENEFKSDKYFEEKMNKMSKSLRDSAKDLSEIQAHLEERKAIADNLKEEVEDAEALLKMSKQQIDAIARKVGRQLRKPTGKDVMFVVIGAVLGGLITIFVASFIQ